ncbi:MAG TPA: hypothetical protein VHG51_01435 [Longimicrobiaceae bacterium]|nr:hypothetical protein [Longimicrobiaceae bacterium]
MDRPEHDDEITRALRGYNPPPPMPRERLWAAIEAGAAEGPADPRGTLPLELFRRRIRPRLATAAAAALALFVGGAAAGYGLRAAGFAAAGGSPPGPEVVVQRVTWF